MMTLRGSLVATEAGVALGRGAIPAVSGALIAQTSSKSIAEIAITRAFLLPAFGFGFTKLFPTFRSCWKMSTADADGSRAIPSVQ